MWKSGISATVSAAFSSAAGASKGCISADKSSAAVWKSDVSATVSAVFSSTAGALNSSTAGVSKGCISADKSSAAVWKSGVSGALSETVSVSYTFRKSCNASGVETSPTVFSKMVSGEEPLRNPASPEGACVPEKDWAGVASSWPAGMSSESAPAVSGLPSVKSGSGVSVTMETGLYGLGVSGSYTLSVDSTVFQSAFSRFWVSSSRVSAPDTMPFCAVSKLSKSKSIWPEGVSAPTSNVCSADKVCSASSSKASGAFPSGWGAVSDAVGISVSEKVISMPSSDAPSGPDSAPSARADSSVRRARLVRARRKSSSRAINAAPPPASSKVYETPNRPSNSPLSVSSSAAACPAGSATGSGATLPAGSATGSAAISPAGSAAVAEAAAS